MSRSACEPDVEAATVSHRAQGGIDSRHRRRSCSPLPLMRIMSCRGGIALARCADEVAIVFAVQHSQVAACPSFNASDRQSWRVREPVFLEPTTFMWNGD